MQFAKLIKDVKQIKLIGRNVKQIDSNVGKLVPMVCNLMIEANNLWTNTQIADTVTDRSEEFRKNLVEHLGYDITKSGKKRVMFKCMVSGVESNGQDIEGAHIAPARSSMKRLAHIGMTPDDVNDVRNGLLLATGIHKAFDHLRLSFIKSNPLSKQLYLKIWDKSCRNIEVYPGAGRKIGEFDGAKLKLGHHEPFKRALSYHAYIAYLKFNFVPSNKLPEEYGSENESEYYSDRRLMRDAVIQDMKDELDSDEGEDGEDASEA